MPTDAYDKKILRILQQDCTRTVESVADEIGLSRNACWRRIRQLEADGVMTGRVALVAAQRVGRGMSVFVMVRTNRHDPEWIEAFDAAVRDMPDIVGVYRTTGEIDYILRARVADMPAYDRLYQQLISRVSLSDVAANFVMEEIKETTEVPID